MVPIGVVVDMSVQRLACAVQPPWWARAVLAVLRRLVADRREPNIRIGGGDVYLERWHVIPRNRWFNVYLHRFLRSDDDRALHDHPWVNLSVLLRGAYLEHRPGGDAPALRRAGAMVLRGPATAHRIELIEERPVWTLFLTGPKVREWGFHCPAGWRHWAVFTNAADGGATVGRGCE